MNPSAPMWVSSLGGGSSSAPPVATPQRSMLDPNTAAFRPKAATTNAPPPDRSTASPPSFTRYVGNPVLSGSSGGGRPASAGSSAGYPPHGATVGSNAPPSAGASNRGMVFSNVAGGSGASPAGARIGPGYGYPPHHHHHHHHHQRTNQSHGHMGHMHHHHGHGHGHTHGHHHSGVGHGHGSGSPANTQIYSAKANTHWGSAGIPQNVQHTHHATNGAVLYNQPSQQKTIESSSGIAPHNSGTREGTSTGAAPTSSTGMSARNAATALHEEILFTPSTRDIWAGTAAVQPDRALDSAIGALMGDGLLVEDPTRTTTHQQATSSPPTADPTAAVEPGYPVVNTLLKSLSSDAIAEERPAESDASASRGLAASSAWHHPPHQQQTKPPTTPPWTKLMAATTAAAATSDTRTAPAEGGTAGSSGSDVDTVQHLLAQLTQGPDRKAHPTSAPPSTKTTTTSTSSVRSTSQQPSSSASSAPGPTSAAQRPVHKTNSTVAVVAPVVVVPPAAIGGSPTSPEIRHGNVTGSSNQPPPRRQGPGPNSTSMASAPVNAVVGLSVDAPKAAIASSMKPPAPRSARQQQDRSHDKATGAAGDKGAAAGVASPPADAEPRGAAVSSSSSIAGTAGPQHHTRAEISAIKLPAGSSRRWANRAVVTQLLVSSKETLRHIKILSFSKQYPEDVAKLFQGWASKGIPAPDDVFGAYYYYVVKKSGMELCMKHNGRGRAPGVGYGGCDFGNRGPNFKCRFHHVCLFCKGEDHGWFDESNCARYQQFRKELDTLKLVEQDVPELLDAYDTLP